MTYFADSSPYAYLPRELTSDETDDDAVNVGWLEATEPFTVGCVEPEFVDRLTELCREGVNRTRGFHRCSLCLQRAPSEPAEPTSVRSSAGDYLVGGAEIRVRGQDGALYAAPDMIVHYVTTHRYRPPDDFVAGVMQSRKM
jgi:hypothetical protein